MVKPYGLALIILIGINRPLKIYLFFEEYFFCYKLFLIGNIISNYPYYYLIVII